MTECTTPSVLLALDAVVDTTEGSAMTVDVLVVVDVRAGVLTTVGVLAVVDVRADALVTVDVLAVVDVRVGACAVVLAVTEDVSVATGAVVMAVVTPPTCEVPAGNTLVPTPAPPPPVPSDSGTAAPSVPPLEAECPPEADFSFSSSATLNNNVSFSPRIVSFHAVQSSFSDSHIRLSRSKS